MPMVKPQSQMKALASFSLNRAFPGGLAINNPPAMQETQESLVQSLGLEDPLEEEIVTHSVSLLGKSHGQRSQAGPWGH